MFDQYIEFSNCYANEMNEPEDSGLLQRGMFYCILAQKWIVGEAKMERESQTHQYAGWESLHTPYFKPKVIINY